MRKLRKNRQKLINAFEYRNLGCKADKNNYMTSDMSVNGIPTYFEFFYHRTAVCVVDTVLRTVSFNRGGFGSRSTTAAINDYKYYFVECLGYVDVTEKGAV